LVNFASSGLKPARVKWTLAYGRGELRLVPYPWTDLCLKSPKNVLAMLIVTAFQHHVQLTQSAIWDLAILDGLLFAVPRAEGDSTAPVSSAELAILVGLIRSLIVCAERSEDTARLWFEGGRKNGGQADTQAISLEKVRAQMEEQARPPRPLYLPEGICRVCEVVAREEFVFCVNGEDYSVAVAEAVFLSPRVFSLLQLDVTIRLFEINDAKIEQSQFEDLLGIVRGRPVKVAASSRVSFLRLSSRLGNFDLVQMLLGLMDEETVIQPVSGAAVGFDLTAQSRTSLLALDLETLAQIFGSEELRIESEDWLLDFILELGEDYRDLLSFVKYEFLSSGRLSTFLDHFDYRNLTDEIWASLGRRLRGEKPTGQASNRYGRAPSVQSSVSGFASTIVSEFPAVLSVIEGKNARLLYRGTRDGFGGSNYHSRLVGHSNLLIIVESSRGWIFGGYAHCKWPEYDWVGDHSLKSFLFTLKNPHNIPARRFGMKSSGQKYVLHPNPAGGYLLWMGFNGAITLSTDCNRSAKSSSPGFVQTNEYPTFANDSGYDGPTLFTGSTTYTVKELEIFEFFD
jgi:hypothetical protein